MVRPSPSRSLRAHRLPKLAPEVWAEFEPLLLTGSAHRSEEDRLGIGWYRDREILLSVALRCLPRRTDVRRTRRVLLDARRAQLEETRARRIQLDTRKNYLEPRQHEYAALDDAITSFLKWRRSWDPLAERAAGSLAARLVAIQLELRVPIQPDLALERFPKLKRGRPPSAVQNAARAALAEAGVPSGVGGWRAALAKEGCTLAPHNLPDAFLMAVGLLKPRSVR